MGFLAYCSVLLTALIAVTSIEASPFWAIDAQGLGLVARDIFVPPTTCDPFVLGANQQNIGNVCVSISGGTLTVTYPTLSPPNAYTDIHVYVGTTAPTDSSPGHFPYTLGNGNCTIGNGGTTATCSIPVQSAWRVCGHQLFIATHAAVTYSGSGQTGWGAGTCFDNAGNCAKYWTFNEQCVCPLVIDFFPITTTV